MRFISGPNTGKDKNIYREGDAFRKKHREKAMGETSILNIKKK